MPARAWRHPLLKRRWLNSGVFLLGLTQRPSRHEANKFSFFWCLLFYISFFLKHHTQGLQLRKCKQRESAPHDPSSWARGCVFISGYWSGGELLQASTRGAVNHMWRGGRDSLLYVHRRQRVGSRQVRPVLFWLENKKRQLVFLPFGFSPSVVLSVSPRRSDSCSFVSTSWRHVKEWQQKQKWFII